MLDMGFIPDIEKIVSKVPPMRQTLLFSATMPPEIRGLAEKFLSNPKQVSVAAAASPAQTVKQSLLWVSQRNKQEALESVIKSEDVKNAFVFCNRKKDVDILAKALSSRKYSAAGMHGDMTQTVRTRTLQEFKDGTITLLICSDVAARGIDIAGVSHVFNYDVPTHPDDYVHRIGRTGRAGMQGRSWTLATADDDKYIKAIESLIKKEIPVETIDGLKTPERDESGESDRGSRRPQGGANRDRSSGSSRSASPRLERKEQQPRPERCDEQPEPQATPSQPQAQPQSQPRAPKPRHQDDAAGGGFSDDDLPAFLRR
jgi:superfamily II DNA/RNA helicase